MNPFTSSPNPNPEYGMELRVAPMPRLVPVDQIPRQNRDRGELAVAGHALVPVPRPRIQIRGTQHRNVMPHIPVRARRDPHVIARIITRPIDSDVRSHGRRPITSLVYRARDTRTQAPHAGNRRTHLHRTSRHRQQRSKRRRQNPPEKHAHPGHQRRDIRNLQLNSQNAEKRMDAIYVRTDRFLCANRITGVAT